MDERRAWTVRGRQRCRYAAAGGIVLAVLLFLFGTCRGDELGTDRASEVVATVLKAYGGGSAVARIGSVTARGRIVEFMTARSGAYARFLERPARLRIEIMPDQGGEVRILNGGRGWQLGRNGFEPSSPVMVQSMVYQYSYLDLPMGFADRSYQVRYEGIRRLGSRETYLLAVTVPNAPELRVYVDARTRLIARVASSFAMGGMGMGELATEYGDFRPVDGVLFPFRLTNYAGDAKLSEIDLSEIGVNRKIPPELFIP